mmetsp:Transcript_17609/g.32769  ORF Transcript_17609/g.32769 Transcript_17609/m.32769 type:complete len:210 (-) Transcript_17609:142-771(-)
MPWATEPFPSPPAKFVRLSSASKHWRDEDSWSSTNFISGLIAPKSCSERSMAGSVVTSNLARACAADFPALPSRLDSWMAAVRPPCWMIEPRDSWSIDILHKAVAIISPPSKFFTKERTPFSCTTLRILFKTFASGSISFSSLGSFCLLISNSLSYCSSENSLSLKASLLRSSTLTQRLQMMTAKPYFSTPSALSPKSTSFVSLLPLHR